jgi:hypothetical protein
MNASFCTSFAAVVALEEFRNGVGQPRCKGPTDHLAVTKYV